MWRHDADAQYEKDTIRNIITQESGSKPRLLRARAELLGAAEGNKAAQVREQGIHCLQLLDHLSRSLESDSRIRALNYTLMG